MTINRDQAAATDHEAVARNVEAFRLAQIAADPKALSVLCSDDLSYSHSSGFLEDKAAFITNVERRITEAVPDARVVMHGHIGDGNIHVLAILDPARVADPQTRQKLVTRINEIVDDETRALRGAISAEHGIGLSNRARLARVTGPVEMELMRRVKAALDPSRVMNPDKIFEPTAE